MVDVVIIGAGGHNGLVASIVLARAGLDVLVLDHVTWPGGLAGYHVVGGVEVPIGGAYVLGLIPSDLMSELGGINVEQYKPEPIAVYVKDGGELVRWWRSFEDRVREFNRWGGLGDNLKAMWSKIVNFHKALRKYMFRLNPPSRDELLNDSVLSEFIKLKGSQFLSQYLPTEF